MQASISCVYYQVGPIGLRFNKPIFRRSNHKVNIAVLHRTVRLNSCITRTRLSSQCAASDRKFLCITCTSFSSTTLHANRRPPTTTINCWLEFEAHTIDSNSSRRSTAIRLQMNGAIYKADCRNVLSPNQFTNSSQWNILHL